MKMYDVGKTLLILFNNFHNSLAVKFDSYASSMISFDMRYLRCLLCLYFIWTLIIGHGDIDSFMDLNMNSRKRLDIYIHQSCIVCTPL